MSRSLHRLGGIAVLIGLGSACSPFGWSEDRFYAKLAKASCEKAFECDTQNASETWFNQDNCEDAYGPIALASMDAHAACAYRRTKAKKYVKRYRKLECTISTGEAADLEAAWDAVYDCEGEDAPGETSDTGRTGDTGLPALTP